MDRSDSAEWRTWANNKGRETERENDDEETITKMTELCGKGVGKGNMRFSVV